MERRSQPIVFIPILLATTVGNLSRGIIITSLWQQHQFVPTCAACHYLGLIASVGLVIWGFGQMDQTTMNTVTSLASNLILMLIIVVFIGAGMFRKINVYDAFIEGAKEGFNTAVRIIPYLVAILVAVWRVQSVGSNGYLHRWHSVVVGAMQYKYRLCGCATNCFDETIVGQWRTRTYA